MKDSEFIELLNLYLDHEITAADAARLEAEVQRSPERRGVYRQYCQMQKACVMLAKNAAEVALAGDSEPRKVVALNRPWHAAWGAGAFASAGLLAAAACVALVLTVKQSPGTAAEPAGASALASAAKPVSDGAAAVETSVRFAPVEVPTAQGSIARTVTIPFVRRGDLQPVLATRGLTLGATVAGTEMSATAELAPQLDWISHLQIAPMQRVQVEDLRFEARPMEAAKSTLYGGRSRPVQQGVVEMAAFQFQK
jgi:hypothetical protein